MVSSINVWNGSPAARYNNLFMIIANPISGYSHKQVEKVIYSEIQDLKKTVKQQELQRVFNQIESDLIFSLSTNIGLAKMLGYYQTIFQDWKYATRYLSEIKKVTIADIQKAIDTYFIKENRTVGMLVKKKSKGK